MRQSTHGREDNGSAARLGARWLAIAGPLAGKPGGCRSELGRDLDRWFQANHSPEDIEAHHLRQRSVRWRSQADGMTVFTRCLPPLLAGVLIAFLSAWVMKSRAHADLRHRRGTDRSPVVRAGPDFRDRPTTDQRVVTTTAPHHSPETSRQGTRSRLCRLRTRRNPGVRSQPALSRIGSHRDRGTRTLMRTPADHPTGLSPASRPRRFLLVSRWRTPPLQRRGG